MPSTTTTSTKPRRGRRPRLPATQEVQQAEFVKYMATKEHRKKAAYKTSMCREYRAGYCPYGDGCTYAHGLDELRVAPMIGKPKHRKYKTALCDNFSNLGWCRYGLKCQFRHTNADGQEALVVPEGPPESSSSGSQTSSNIPDARPGAMISEWLDNLHITPPSTRTSSASAQSLETDGSVTPPTSSTPKAGRRVQFEPPFDFNGFESPVRPGQVNIELRPPAVSNAEWFATTPKKVPMQCSEM
ncbi:unnamed protein product, partial [Mesorhabditis spiculigera]